MAWVLILFMVNGGQGAAIDHIGFGDERTCMAALAHAEMDGRPEIWGFCAPRSFDQDLTDDPE